MQTIIFGGGCFWCMEAVFQMLKGVKSVTSGYAGGRIANPTYQEVNADLTGHAEVIKIEFDPGVVVLEELLAVFFTSHDPTTLNRQGNDVGAQYRSVIYYNSPEQKSVVDNFMNKLTADQVFSKPIITEVQPLEVFYKAEEYHQNYYRQNQDQPYCQAVINPKIAKLRQKFLHLLS